MRNLTGWVAAFLLPMAAGGMGTASAAPLLAPETRPQASAAPGGLSSVPAAKGRLKFKTSGPVCMCAEGLSERDIEQALAKLQPEKTAGQDSVTRQTSVSGQEKNLNLGVAK